MSQSQSQSRSLYSPESKTDDQKHVSQSMIHAFQPSQRFLQFCLRFPFNAYLTGDGTWTFEYNRYSFAAISFYLSSIVAVILFAMIFVGTLYGYFSRELPRDGCSQTWESAVMTRQFVPIMFSLTQLFTTMVGSLYVLCNGSQFVHLFNYWNKALQQLNLDPTEGVRKRAVTQHAWFAGVLVVVFIINVSGLFPPAEEASGFFVQALVALFKKNLYANSDHGKLTLQHYTNISENCCDCQTKCFYAKGELSSATKAFCDSSCYTTFTKPSFSFQLMRWIGFIIQIYALLGARCLILQFEFFCHLLINTCRVWNKRLSNGLSLVNREEDHSDPAKRRLGFKDLLMDHCTIIQLFSMTEENFAVVLQTYYASLFVNIICQFYYLALLNSQLTCSEAVQQIVDYGTNCSNYLEIRLKHHYRSDDGETKTFYSFEDPCRNLSHLRGQSAWVALAFFAFTLYTFISSVSDAAQASSEGTAGFIRLRKHGYMCCQSKVERHFVHTLVFSFAGPNPIQITAGGFFILRRRIILIVLSTCFIYFLIILGFKPGIVKSGIRCLDRKRRDMYP